MTNKKHKKIRIEADRIYLKTLNEKNATHKYCNWLNDPEVNEYLETRDATIDDLKVYIKSKNQDPNAIFLGIFMRNNDEHIGNIKLEPIDFKNKIGTIGILIGEKQYWNKGFGTEAVKILVQYAFDNLNLDEVNLGVISKNKAAIGVYEKVGFKIDNIEKNAIVHGDVKYDKVVMNVKRNAFGE